MTNPVSRHRPAEWSAAEEEALPANIPALLDGAASRYPTRTLWRSIDGDATELTYGAFRDLTVACALKLADLGVGRGTHVGIMLPNVPAFLICWIALGRLGAAGVLINVSSTSAELERSLTETRVEFLLVDRKLTDAYLNIRPEVRLPRDHIILHGPGDAEGSLSDAVDWSVLTRDVSATRDVQSASTLDDIAGILFTSGSSGVPKGCMLSHRYWLTLGKARSVLGPTPENILVDTPMFYMGSLWKILMGLYCGATLNVALRYSLSRLFDRIVENDIDFCTVTAPTAKLGPDPRFPGSSLKWLTTYGLTKEVHESMEARFGVPVREIYGMTEAGSVLSMPAADRSMVGSGSCGLPAAFRECKLVSTEGEVSGEGVGELWASGPGMFSGYFGNPSATDASFEDGWFRTGDLFRRDADGYYYMLGRIKDVIRRSSENISAAEVEFAVSAIGGVFEVAAVPVPDPLRGEEVKVVIARSSNGDGEQLTPMKILAHCRTVLSAFKVPRYVEFLDALPKTASAKIDKVKLKTDAIIISDSVFDAARDTGSEVR